MATEQPSQSDQHTLISELVSQYQRLVLAENQLPHSRASSTQPPNPSSQEEDNHTPLSHPNSIRRSGSAPPFLPSPTTSHQPVENAGALVRSPKMFEFASSEGPTHHPLQAPIKLFSLRRHDTTRHGPYSLRFRLGRRRGSTRWDGDLGMHHRDGSITKPHAHPVHPGWPVARPAVARTRAKHTGALTRIGEALGPRRVAIPLTVSERLYLRQMQGRRFHVVFSGGEGRDGNREGGSSRSGEVIVTVVNPPVAEVKPLAKIVEVQAEDAVEGHVGSAVEGHVDPTHSPVTVASDDSGCDIPLLDETEPMDLSDRHGFGTELSALLERAMHIEDKPKPFMPYIS
ncbi:hypothetical protein HK104_002244 [Borealophlyctis nickersoniae]|nr:hypothetical protein HK104_002244 [Borealophlyctis nickersoniae]